jgi:hypothetical protein
MKSLTEMETTMKHASLLWSTLILGSLLMVYGCATTDPGATNTLGVYSTNVDSTPDKVTEAAGKACADLKLTDIASSATMVDGKVTAKLSDGNDVAINVEQAGDGVSKVSIHVGVSGDEAVSKQLVEKIRSHLSWFGM